MKCRSRGTEHRTINIIFPVLSNSMNTALLQTLTVTQLVKKFSFLLWNPQVHYRIHNTPPLVPVLSQMSPFNIFTPFFPKIHSNIILLFTPSSFEWFLSFSLSNQNNVFLIPTMRATCLTNHILVYFISMVKLLIMQSSPACQHFLLLRQGPLLKNTFTSFSPLSVKDQVSHPYKTTGKIMDVKIINDEYPGSFP